MELMPICRSRWSNRPPFVELQTQLLAELATVPDVYSRCSKSTAAWELGANKRELE